MPLYAELSIVFSCSPARPTSFIAGTGYPEIILPRFRISRNIFDGFVDPTNTASNGFFPFMGPDFGFCFLYSSDLESGRHSRDQVRSTCGQPVLLFRGRSRRAMRETKIPYTAFARI